MKACWVCLGGLKNTVHVSCLWKTEEEQEKIQLQKYKEFFKYEKSKYPYESNEKIKQLMINSFYKYDIEPNQKIMNMLGV